LFGTRDGAFPCAEGTNELCGPLVNGLKDHTSAFPSDDDLVVVVGEAKLLGEADSLAAAILEQLGASVGHGGSIYRSIYYVNPESDGQETRQRACEEIGRADVFAWLTILAFTRRVGTP
jgi:hypothetical protein